MCGAKDESRIGVEYLVADRQKKHPGNLVYIEKEEAKRVWSKVLGYSQKIYRLGGDLICFAGRESCPGDAVMICVMQMATASNEPDGRHKMDFIPRGSSSSSFCSIRKGNCVRAP